MSHDTPPAKSNSWWQLTLQVPLRWAEDASAVLIEAGALGVQTLGGGDEPLPKFARQAITAQSAQSVEAGQAILVASYSLDADAQDIKRAAQEALTTLQLKVPPERMLLVQRDDSSWAETWKQYFKPLKIGRRVWVVPTWERNFVAPTNTVVLRLDPGMAFGTGQHATTSLCLRAIELYAERLGPTSCADLSLCDLGCGSGILAIGAAKLGFGSVLALDNDPLAVSATRDNVAQNAVAAQVSVQGTPIAETSQRFTVVVANILAQPLIEMAGAIAARLAPGGTLLLSGLLSTQADSVQRAFEQTGQVRYVQRWTHGEWTALDFVAAASF
jgi:ribosomal protein L11 methyltransferase